MSFFTTHITHVNCDIQYDNLHISRGAQKVLCAFRAALSFSTVIGQFKYVEKDVLGVITP